MKLDPLCNGQVESSVISEPGEYKSLKIVEPSLKSPCIFSERKVLKSARGLRLFKGDLTVVPDR